MYKINVPLTLSQIKQYGAEHFISSLKKTDCTTVLISIGTITQEGEFRRKLIADLSAETAKFKAAGYKVGVWLWTFIRENEASDDFKNVVSDVKSEVPYEHRHLFNGEVRRNEVCPLDEDYLADEELCMKELAASGVDLILFDDDMVVSLAYLADFGCCCDKHMELYRSILGEDVTKEEFIEKIFRGGANKYRDAWLEGNRRTLLDFAKRMRAAADTVNPDVRIGNCSVMSTYDADGATCFEISKILAGKNKPYMRLIGAPYWGEKRQFTCRPADTWNMHKMEVSWCEDDDIEIFCEGDVFPRPRYNVPASHLELFDMVTRAENRIDGIMRYMYDYTSSVDYETGYIDRYLKNKPIYDIIEKEFKGKRSTGVRVYEAQHKLRDIELPEDSYVGTPYLDKQFYSPAGHLLNYNSLASIYSGKGTAGIAFGENAKLVDAEALAGGLILDVPAALKLMKRGIDVGLVSARVKENQDCEYFTESGELCARFPDMGIQNSEYALEVSPGAIVTSYFGNRGDGKYPSCYKYENAEGMRFVVFGFDAYRVNEVQFRCYERQRQLTDAVEWLSGSKPDAVCRRCPDLYIMTKRSEGKLAVGLANAFIDTETDMTVELSEKWNECEFVNCTGRLEGDRVFIDILHGYEFAALILKK